MNKLTQEENLERMEELVDLAYEQIEMFHECTGKFIPMHRYNLN